MNPHFIAVLVAISIPFTTVAYSLGKYDGHDQPRHSYLASGDDNRVEDLINAAGSQQAVASITAAADVGATHGAHTGLAQANAQLQALNSNPDYQNLKNSESIAEKIAENNLASNIRQGKINIVAPNVVGQAAYRSLHIPHGLNNHQVIATQPLPPIVVSQPGSPPAQINSGPPAVVRAAPIVYKLKPSIIYQQEVINKIPTPLSLNPVYVKVYKPGKHIDAPVSAAAYAPPSYKSSYDSASSVAAQEPPYEAPQYASTSHQYGEQPASYNAQQAY